MKKTNVMRILDSLKIDYKTYTYTGSGSMSGTEVANELELDPNQVFKTLVTVCTKTKSFYVFLIPVNEALDLKKAAKSVGEKQLEMLKQKDLLPITGYIHGGCSPIGMKKVFTTTIHESISQFDTIIFSAGKIGYQVEIPVDALEKAVDYSTGNIII